MTTAVEHEVLPFVPPEPVQLTEEQHAEFRDAFDAFRERDGPKDRIAAAACGPCMKAIGLHMTESDMAKVTIAADFDGTGYTTFKEFLKLVADRMVDPGHAKEMWDAFRVFDPKWTGVVTITRFRQIMTSLGEDVVTDEDVDEMIYEADVREIIRDGEDGDDDDGSGLLDYAAFIRVLASK